MTDSYSEWVGSLKVGRTMVDVTFEPGDGWVGFDCTCGESVEVAGKGLHYGQPHNPYDTWDDAGVELECEGCGRKFTASWSTTISVNVEVRNHEGVEVSYATGEY